MSTKIFVNLPVRDLNKSVAFFTQLGYTFNPQFTDANATCMIIAEEIYAMLLVEPFFQTFTPRMIADAKKQTEVLVALMLDSREEVDRLVDTALAAGGTAVRPVEDSGWMYGRSFADLDGHIWEVGWMDPAGPPAT